MSEVGDMSDEYENWPPVIPESQEPEEILSRFANELRHPINSIKGYARLIAGGKMDSQEAAGRVKLNAEQMDVLRNAVLDYLERRKAAPDHDGS
jgi:signal transduction histidine kinase